MTMSHFKRSSALLVLPAVLGLGAVGASKVDAGAGGSQPVRCEIRVTKHGGSVTLEGVVVGRTSIQGSYTLRVSKSGGGGSSDIDQSGNFSAVSGASTTIGVVSLGGGGSYVAKLKVTADGRTTECTERVAGAL
jgi:hypothetical protein